MRQALEILGFLVGAVAVGAVLTSAVQAVVLPRASRARIPWVSVRMVRILFALRARRMSTYQQRDRIMAELAPAALMAMLVTWLVVLFLAYVLMFFCAAGRSVAASFQLSGSSMVTLGTNSVSDFWPSLLMYTEAAFGLLIVALFITYFPSIYAAFTRRERGVTLLDVRAGIPPRATTMLIRYHRIEERRYQLGDLWRQWEAWFADIEESHTTFPILVFFRSPEADRSWVTAAGTLLDAASFWIACVTEHSIDPDAQLCVRAGFLALRRIGQTFSLSPGPEPAPDDPITISRSEWDDAMAEMEEAGVPLVEDREQAWSDWKGWRVNYDSVLLLMARLVEAPPAPWISDRSPVSYPPGPPSDSPGRRPTSRRGWPKRSR